MTLRSLEQLSHYKSVLRSEIIDHLEQLIMTLNETDLYRGDQKLLVEDTAIIPSVIWYGSVLAEEETSAKSGGLRSMPFLDIFSRGTGRETSGRDAMPLEHLFQGDSGRLVIKGDAGSGKTFITRKRAIEVARSSIDDLRRFRGALEEIVLPIWTDANEISACVSKNYVETLMTIVSGSHPGYGAFARLGEWYRTQLIDEGKHRRAKHILFIDGLDELLQTNQNAFAKVLRQLSSFQGRAVLACRSWRWESLRSLVDWPQASIGELASFTAKEQEIFLKKFFRDDEDENGDRMLQIIDANHSLGSALRSPMLLTYACLLHDVNQLDTDLARNDLYDRIVGRLFDCTFPPKAKPSWMLAENHEEGQFTRIRTNQFLFEEISLQLFRRETGGRDFSLQDWNSAFESALAETMFHFPSADELISSEAFVRDLLGIRLMVQSTGQDGSYNLRYLHRTFLEYASARALARRENWLRVAKTLFWDFDGWGVLAFLASEIKDIKPLIEGIREEEPDIFGTMFLLEAMMVAAASPKDTFNFEVSDEFAALTLRLFTQDSRDNISGFLNFRHGEIYSDYITTGTRSLLARDATRRRLIDILYPHLMGALESASADLQSTLSSKIRIFCDLGLTEAKLSLRLLLQDAGKASTVRVFAAYALASLRDLEAARILIDIVRNSPKKDKILRCNCAIALKSFDSIDTTFFLEILTDHAEDHFLRSYIAALLNPSQRDKAIDTLLTQYKSQQGKVQEESFELLSLLDTKKNRPDLTNLFKRTVDNDRTPMRQKLAILYIGRNGIDGCTNSLLRIVANNTEHIDVRIAAAAALGELRFQPAYDRLSAIAEDSSEKSEIRCKAIDVLVSVGLARSISDWRKVVILDGSDSEGLIRSIISVWSTTKNELTIPLLANIVRDPVRSSVELRTAAATGLVSIAVGNTSSIAEVTKVLLSCKRTDYGFENQLDDIVAAPLFYLWQSGATSECLRARTEVTE